MLNLITKIFSGVKAINESWNSKLPNEEQDKALLEDETYLLDKNKPDVIVVVSALDEKTRLNKFDQREALLLKGLTKKYNVKIVGCDTGNPPENHKDNHDYWNQLMKYDGISEIYYLFQGKKAVVQPDQLKIADTKGSESRKALCDMLCEKYQVTHDKCLFVEPHRKYIEELITTAHSGFDYEVLENVRQLPKAIANLAQPKAA